MSSTLNPELAKLIHIYPNPVSELARISTQLELEKAVIYNISGQIVQTIPNPTEIIDVSSFSKGLYIIALYTAEGLVSKKLIVQ